MSLPIKRPTLLTFTGDVPSLVTSEEPITSTSALAAIANWRRPAATVTPARSLLPLTCSIAVMTLSASAIAERVDGPWSIRLYCRKRTSGLDLAVHSSAAIK